MVSKTYTVCYTAKDKLGEEHLIEDAFPMHNNYTNEEAYVLKGDLLSDIKSKHKDYVEVVIKRCSIRVWNSQDCGVIYD